MELVINAGISFDEANIVGQSGGVSPYEVVSNQITEVIEAKLSKNKTIYVQILFKDDSYHCSMGKNYANMQSIEAGEKVEITYALVRSNLTLDKFNALEPQYRSEALRPGAFSFRIQSFRMLG